VGRAPIVIASTVAGLVLVLSYNPRSSSLASTHTATSLATTAGGGSSAPSGAATAATTSTGATSAAGPATGTGATGGGAGTASTKAPAGTTVTGSLEDIDENGRQFGQIQVTATVANGTVTKVGIAQLTPYDGRSQSIDDYAVPQLEQETLDAGSAQIDGVSGATYTSEAYVASLQSALDQAGA
jgi:uncharacterized protein with FMN-binding domain